jgi:hypothetical protein
LLYLNRAMSRLISSKLLVTFAFTILVFNLISTIICEPLTSQVLEYLDKDKETFLEYRSQYKFLACKVLTYSRMKYLFEKETIDGYLNQTINKRGFLDYMQENILNYCTGIYSDSNMVNSIIVIFRKFSNRNCSSVGTLRMTDGSM